MNLSRRSFFGVGAALAAVPSVAKALLRQTPEKVEKAVEQVRGDYGMVCLDGVWCHRTAPAWPYYGTTGGPGECSAVIIRETD